MFPVPDGYIRLFRVENTRRQRYRPVEGLSGRWFSDDLQYVEEHYADKDTQWTYVDVPRELAESFRYENVVRTPAGRDLYGVEGKDFILPPEWANLRVKIERPDDQLRCVAASVPSLSEITSNVATVGRVLYYNSTTGDVLVVEEVNGDEAVILHKNRAKNKESYVRKTVPIRKVKRIRL